MLSACSSEAEPVRADDPSESVSAAPSDSPSASASPTAGEEIEGTFSVGDRDLYISCTGTGSPTVVLEAGEGVPSNIMGAPIKEALSQDIQVCAYDRANVGSSGSAPVPRTGKQVASDLHGLLEAAKVPAPYVLVGHSAGGLFVQSYARAYPQEVAGVVAMNPVPPWKQWVKRAFPDMTKEEREGETGYFAGENGESFDYRATSEELDADQVPDSVPFHMLISTIAQCESPKDICGRTYPAYTAMMKQISGQWSGQFTQTPSGHEIYLEDLEAVTAAIKNVSGT